MKSNHPALLSGPRLPRAAFLFALLLPALPWRCPAETFVFTKIVDTNDPVPGKAGTLFLPASEPSLDGATVAFRNGGAFAWDSIWTQRPGAPPLKLVDLNTPVPGGIGNFSSFFVAFSAPGIPSVRGGSVVFAGRDSNPNGGFNVGLYAVPAAGGPVTRVVDYNTAVPGGSSNFKGGLADFSLDAGRVAFQGSGDGNSGIFGANLNGSGLAALADANHPAHPEFTFPVSNFSAPFMSGNTAAFFGNTVFDPSNGYNALYTVSAATGFAYTEWATSNQPLPGNPNGNFHTRFNAPRLDGSTLAFRADDSNSNPDFVGLYTSKAPGTAFTKIADVTDRLPALGTLTSNSFGSYALSGDQVAFTAVDDQGKQGFYLSTGGVISQVLTTGDFGPFADTHARVNGVSIGREAVSNGQILFQAFGAATGVYLASPLSLSADLQPGFSPNLTSAAVGSNITFNVTLTNNGPATAQTVTLQVALPVGLTFQSASGGVYDASTRTVTFALASLAPGANNSFAVIARVEATGVLTATAFVSSLTPDSNRLNNHAYASANAAPSSSLAYVFRKIVDNMTPVPDRAAETFAIPGGDLTALDGNKVVFISSDPQGKNVIWSANADGSGDLKRLVDVATSVPAGGGTTFDSLQLPRLRNDVVTFRGFGADQMHDGIYSVPVGGGAVASVVNSGSLRPEGTGIAFDYAAFYSGFSMGNLSDGQIGFTAQGGVYAYPAQGNGAGRVLVYPGSAIPIAAANNGSASAIYFGGPALSGTRAIFPVYGGSVALVGTYLDERRFFALADVQTPSPSLPGTTFVLSDANFANSQLEGDTVIFRAFSGMKSEIKGIYSITGDGPVVKLVDTNTAVPGGNGSFTGFSAAGSPDTFAISAGEVVFLGTDADNRGGLYSVPAPGGAIRKIIAVGDMLDSRLQLNGNPSFFQPPLQPNSLGQHRLIFRADFIDKTTGTGAIGLFVATPAPTTLGNISTRLRVETGDDVLIGGFIVTGTQPKKVLLRAIGPSLPVGGTLGDPFLELHDGTGSLIFANDNWKDAQQAQIEATTIPPNNDLESAIVATLPANRSAYTAVVRGVNNGTGVGLVEVYDLDRSVDSKLANISTRGLVQTGDDVMIGGFIVGGGTGGGNAKVIVRALGPSLPATNALGDPTLELHDGSGAIIATNDNWKTRPDGSSQQAEIEATTIPPTNELESAIVANLAPGNYTAIVRGAGQTTGVGLVEVFHLAP